MLLFVTFHTWDTAGLSLEAKCTMNLTKPQTGNVKGPSPPQNDVSYTMETVTA